MPNQPIDLSHLAEAFWGPRQPLAASQGVPLKVGEGLLENAAYLEDNLLVLTERTGVPALTPSATGAARQQYEQLLRAVRMRLDRLGYAVGDPTSGKPDGELLKALNRFRPDAGLGIGSIVIDPATWGALQELVALEPPFHIEKWYPLGGQPRPALVRAVQLRLTTLGLRPNTPVDPAEAVNLRIQLARFRGVAYSLGIIPNVNLSEREVMTVLLEHDTLLEKVALGGPGVRKFLEQLELSEKDLKTTEERFLLRLARNELWLNGYPLGDIREPVSQQKLRKALGLYWLNLPDRPVGVSLEELTTRVTLELFEDLARQQREDDVPREQLATFVAENEPLLEDYWTREVANSDFFIWDGIKRAFKWLKRQAGQLVQALGDLVQRGIDFARTLVKNVVRSLFQSVNEVLVTVGKAASAFVDGMGIYLRGEVRSEGPVLSAVCGLNVDGDATLFVDEVAPSEGAWRMLKRLERVAASLDLAGSVLALVIGLITSAAKGVIGWLLLLAKLVRAGPEIAVKVKALAALG